MAQKRRGKGPKSAAKPKKKPKNHVITPKTGSIKLTGYPPELTAKVDKLVAALPPGEERDELTAEMTASKPNPQRLRRILQLIIKEFAPFIGRLAIDAMETLIQHFGN